MVFLQKASTVYVHGIIRHYEEWQEFGRCRMVEFPFVFSSQCKTIGPSDGGSHREGSIMVTGGRVETARWGVCCAHWGRGRCRSRRWRVWSRHSAFSTGMWKSRLRCSVVRVTVDQ